MRIERSCVGVMIFAKWSSADASGMKTSDVVLGTPPSQLRLSFHESRSSAPVQTRVPAGATYTRLNTCGASMPPEADRAVTTHDTSDPLAVTLIVATPAAFVVAVPLD